MKSTYTTIFDLTASGNPTVWSGDHPDYPGEIVVEFDLVGVGGKSRWKLSEGQAEYLATAMLQELQERDMSNPKEMSE